LEERLVSLEKFKDGRMIDLLKQTPSSYLGSCRKKLPPLNEGETLYKKIFDVFEKYNIGYVFCIGGNDSMDTTDKLSAYAKNAKKETRVVGIPKTVDNDLVMTDHTPGYGSAAKFVANCMRQLALDTDVYRMPSVVVLEAMGRNAGWLTAAAALANDKSCCGADIVCLPERSLDKDRFLAKVEMVSKDKKTIMVAVSEGVRDKEGNYIKENAKRGGEEHDRFGHAALGGAGKTVEAWISSELGFKSRSIELSTLQRCFAACASRCDVEEAFLAGYKGAGFAFDGITGVMAGFERIADKPYAVDVVPLPVSEIANKEKSVPMDMIADDGFGMTQKFFDYAMPLICGEPELIYENGVLQFAPSIG
jgi:6-phosphofructokinase 1